MSRIFRVFTCAIILLSLLIQTQNVYAAGTLTGSLGGTQCRTIAITSSGFDPDNHHIEVEWYAEDGTIIGTDKNVPVNQSVSFDVSQQPAGIHYRAYDKSGNYVTPLKDQSAACVVVGEASASIQLEMYDCAMQPIDGMVAFTANTSFNWDTEGKYNETYTPVVKANTGPQQFTNKIGKTSIVNMTYRVPDGFKIISEENMTYTNTTNGLTKVSLQQSSCSSVTTEAPTTEVPTTEAPTKTPYPVNTDGYTPIADGNFSNGCVVKWYAKSVIDTDLVNMPNNGYFYKVRHNSDGSPNYGYMSVQHWANATTGDLFWRIPIGTQYGIKNAKVIVPYGDNWTPDTTSFSILREDFFTRFTEQDSFATQMNISNVTYEFTDTALVINLGDIPADHHFMFMFTAKANDGGAGIKAGNEYYADATLTGDFIASADNPTCQQLVPTTEEPTTEAPTTETPTTEAPTTEAPTTEAPTTETPTTEAPTTEAPTTETPTTEEPTTEAPTTEAPTTEEPTTEAPTTETPTTEEPTTEAPTTEAPTTEEPTTEAPTTEIPTTGEPTTEAPTTEVLTTEVSTTEVPITIAPTTEVPTTEASTTEVSTTDMTTSESPMKKEHTNKTSYLPLTGETGYQIGVSAAIVATMGLLLLIVSRRKKS